MYVSSDEESRSHNWPDLQIMIQGELWNTVTLRFFGYTEEVSGLAGWLVIFGLNLMECWLVLAVGICRACDWLSCCCRTRTEAQAIHASFLSFIHVIPFIHTRHYRHSCHSYTSFLSFIHVITDSQCLLWSHWTVADIWTNDLEK